MLTSSFFSGKGSQRNNHYHLTGLFVHFLCCLITQVFINIIVINRLETETKIFTNLCSAYFFARPKEAKYDIS